MKRLRYRLDFYKETSADGAEAPTYTLWKAEIPVDIVPVSGGEIYRGRQIEATATHVVTMRHIEGVLPTMRLKDTKTEQLYHIEKLPKREGRDYMIDLQCREIVL